jgi:tetratricopeptide (TPR) repeat protein
MRCISLRSLVLTIAALATLAAGPIAAADETPQLPSEIRVKASGSAATTNQDVAQEPAPAVISAKPADRLPTPAKRRPGAGLKPVDSGASPLVPPPPANPRAGDAAAKPKAADESLRPIPDPLEGAPASIETASFKGVVPGVSTAEVVEKAWGKPKQSTRVDGAPVQLYSVEPFRRVEVHYAEGKVSSVVIRFERPFPADGVAKQLDLAAVRAVLVSNEMGEALGLSYPERGVVLSLEAGTEPGKASMKVSQIILEPISAEPFVLRAETTLRTRYDLSRRDLEQALKLEPGNARAHWLHARVLAATEQHEKAMAAAAEAVRLDPGNAQFRVTHAQTLAEVGRFSEAAEEAQRAVQTSQNRPHINAQATSLMGDLTASGPKPDFRKALSLHAQAIQLADPLSSDRHPAIRVAAKEAMVDAYLGAAHDIAWGEWKEKPKAVTKWLERAVSVADDLVTNEGSSQEQLFRVYARALGAYVGVRGGIDPGPTIAAVIDTGDKLIAAARDPGHKAQLQWELGMALYDAVQICQMRGDHEAALKHGQAAAAYLAKANEANASPTTSFLLGRLYFRLGTIHALRDHDHKAAVVWFDKAAPLLEGASPEALAADLGRHGESFVGMGVSYWEAGQREKAVALTQKGIKWMEQAVKQGTLDNSALAVPYGNLASMHRKLGAADKAEHYQEMASRVKAEKLK